MAPNLTDDVSQVVVLLEANPYFWGSKAVASSDQALASQGGLTFETFFQHVLLFVNCILLLNHSNRIVIIATGASTCAFLYDSNLSEGTANNKNGSKGSNRRPELRSTVITQAMQEFVQKEEEAAQGAPQSLEIPNSNLSGALSMALCYIQRVFRGPLPHPQPRILCLQGSPDAPQQYIAIMNSIFSAQKSAVPIDACIVGNKDSAFLQQASHITGGIYLKPPQSEGLIQYLTMVFATDLYSRQFLQLPRPVGVDFRASCFCHKKTIDMGYVCSVCLSIFCTHHKSCSTCGADFTKVSLTSLAGMKRKVSGS